MKFISYCSKTFSPAVSKFLVVTGLSMSFASCQWGDQVDALVQPNPDDFTAVYSDTNSVSLSTLKLDSLMTGASSRLLVGQFTDPYLGKMHGTAFVQFGTNSGGGTGALTLPANAVYDSLGLALRYDGYYYGDTTKVLNVDVHELTSDLTLKADLTPIPAIYNYHATPYISKPVGSAKIYPRPRPRIEAGTLGDGTRRLEVRVKISDVLGKKIFDAVKANKITSNAQWIELLKGFAVKALSENNSVVGFTQGNTALRLYYHTPGALEGIARDSVSVNLSANYNQTLGDRTGTVLSGLPNTFRSSLPSAQTGNMSFVQAGTGIMTRMDFPGLGEYKYLDYTFANSARIIVEPLRGSFSKQLFLPPALFAYLCDKNNDYVYSGGSPVSGLTGMASAPLTNDFLNDRQYYTLDVTEFIRNNFQNESLQKYGLLLRTSSPIPTSNNFNMLDGNTEFSKSFDRLVLGDQKNPKGKVKLEVYYTLVKNK
jgi:hypothetical protein